MLSHFKKQVSDKQGLSQAADAPSAKLHSADADVQALIPWFKAAALSAKEEATTDVRIKLRGNILHALCQSSQSDLVQEDVLMRLVRSLMQPEVKARFEAEFPQVHQIYVYNRRTNEAKPAWSAPVYLNRLERQLERLVAEAATQTEAESLSEALVRSLSAEVGSAEVGSAETGNANADGANAGNVNINGVGSVDTDSLEGVAESDAQADIPVLPRGVSSASKSQASPAQVSDLMLARKGDSAAIARYLSEALGALNVGVKVNARIVPGKPKQSEEQVSRLWIFCEASYSPDPILIAEPIAQRLRQLHLRQFQDAVITIQVTGEAASDWRLRVDLTPPEDMLQAWGRWGDLPALSLLANQVARRYGLKLVTEIKKDTLHLISYAIADVTSRDQLDRAQREHDIDVDSLVSELSEMFAQIAPRGIQRAMLYGPSTDDISPEWLRGIDLPAAEDLALQESTSALAKRGDMSALAYCLTRSLNPDIKDQLSTGGIRVQLLLKENLLHIMADGPVCPPKSAIVPLIHQTLEGADVAAIAEGVRLYGRRAGQKQPIWTHGKDYQSRQRVVPEAKPEFAASEAYIGELIKPVGEKGLADSDGTDADEDVRLLHVLTKAVQYALLKSQVFIPADDPKRLRTHASGLPKVFQAQSKRMALIWGAVGVLLAVQFDFLIGQGLQQASAPIVASAEDVASATEDTNGAAIERVRPNRFGEELADLDWDGEGRRAETEGFFASAGEGGFSGDFTSSANDEDELIYSPQQGVVATESLLASANLPSFRSQQLDEKLALYRRRVAQEGPPDVLIIGSSRALRGVDPAALRLSLEAAGYEGLSFFNFGVNGATAQVVDLIVRRLIPPDQLPQMIVWADGARAFNSGRVDVTFNAIAESEGFRKLENTNTPGGINDLVIGGLSDQLTQRAQAADKHLSEFFGQVSSGYTNRNRIRTALSQSFGAIAPEFTEETNSTRAGDTPTGAPTETTSIDLDGFLALSTRFNPATYYQEHARVKGQFDRDYKDFQMEGTQSQALDNLLKFTVSQRIPVIFINTPLTDEYLDSHRTRAEDVFTQYMVQVSDGSNAFIYKDFGNLWPQRYDYFSDPSHLNRYGAYQVSTRLAQDPLIEWPEPLVDEDIAE